MGHVATETKSNEIEAIPRRLKLLDLKGCVVTLDATGCHSDSAEAIVEADTVVLIKDLKPRGSSQVLKQFTKAKGIRLVECDHKIDFRLNGSSIAPKACFMKKAWGTFLNRLPRALPSRSCAGT